MGALLILRKGSWELLDFEEGGFGRRTLWACACLLLCLRRWRPILACCRLVCQRFRVEGRWLVDLQSVMPPVASGCLLASGWSPCNRHLRKDANSAQFWCSHMPPHSSCQSGCSLVQAFSLQRPMVIHLSHAVWSPVARRMAVITGLHIDFARVCSGSLSSL